MMVRKFVISKHMTINLGNFNSMKVGCELEIEPSADEMELIKAGDLTPDEWFDLAWEEARGKVDQKVQQEIDIADVK